MRYPKGVTFGLFLWCLAAAAARAAAPSPPGRCQSAPGKGTAKAIWNEATHAGASQSSFVRVHEPYERRDPGPTAVFGENAFIADFLDAGGVTRIHRIDLRTGDHRVYDVGRGIRIQFLLAASEDTVGGLVSKRREAHGDRMEGWGPGNVLFRFRLASGSYEELGVIDTSRGVRPAGKQLIGYHGRGPVVVDFEKGTVSSVAAAEITDAAGRAYSQSLEAGMRRVRLVRTSDGGSPETLVVERSGPKALDGQFSITRLEDGSIFAVFERGAKRAGYLLAPDGRRVGTVDPGPSWRTSHREVDVAAAAVIQTCIDTGRPLRIYRDALRLEPWPAR